MHSFYSVPEMARYWQGVSTFSKYHIFKCTQKAIPKSVHKMCLYHLVFDFVPDKGSSGSNLTHATPSAGGARIHPVSATFLLSPTSLQYFLMPL